MHAASRHGTPSLMSLPKDGGVSCFGRPSSCICFILVFASANTFLFMKMLDFREND